MKKRILILLVVVLALAATASLVWARGGPNGTHVHFGTSSLDCNSYWLKTASGLVHQWRHADPNCDVAGGGPLHYVFKPADNDKFTSADCDVDDGFLGEKYVTVNLGAYIDFGDDDADLEDFLDDGAHYWRCLYQWTE